MEDSHRDEHPERGEDEDRRGRDRPSRWPAWNSEYTTSGSVWVRPSKLPANMIVAPNSPSARAQVITSPAASAAPASGTVINRKSCASVAPSTRAASSRSRLTVVIPARAERTKNGADTKVCASTTATVVKATSSPAASERTAERPRRPSRAGARGRRRTAEGRSAGRRSPRRATCPGRSAAPARSRAAGRCRPSGPGSRPWSRGSGRAPRARRRSRRRYQANHRRPTGQRARPRAGRGTPRTALRGQRATDPPGPIGGPEGLRASSVMAAAPGTRSRRGSPARRARRTSRGMPGRPGSRSEALTTTPAYVAGTFASSGTSIVRTFVDAAASVAYTIPASPSPSSILAISAFTFSSRETTLAA